MVTVEKLILADKDVDSIGEAANEVKVVTPRYGNPYKSVPLAVQEIEESGIAAVAALNAKADELVAQGFYESYTTEAILLAATPAVSEMRARADDTRKIWRWNRSSAEGVIPVVGTWTDTGLSDKDIAAADATAKANAAEANAKDFANSNPLFKPVPLVDPFDFNDLTVEGFHYIFSGATFDACLNKPESITNQWARVEIIRISEKVIGQKLWCLNAQKMLTRFRNASSVWSAWSIFSDDVALTAIVKAAVNIDRDATFDSRSINSTSPVYESLSKNIFDKSLPQLLNTRITSTGTTEEHINSVTSQLVYVKGSVSIALSGLQASAAAFRAYRFLDANKIKISNGSFAPADTSKIIAVPSNAVWFQQTLKDGSDAGALDTSALQIESGITATAYVAYQRGKLKNISGADLFVDSAQVKDILNPVFSSKSKNIFDKDALVKDVRITATGELETKLNSVMTRLISVKELTSIALSGLQASTVAYRAYRFLDVNKAKISNSSIAPNLTEKIIPVPAGAVWFQLCIKDSSDSWVLDTSTIQIEAGNAITAYTPYVRGNLLSLYDADIDSSGSSTGSTSAAFGARYLIFGDSITETSNVDAGIYDQVTYRTQWPSYAYEKLSMSQFRNYAKSGASFRNRSLSNLYQYLGYQVERAIADNESTDVVIVSCGTNDGVTNLGDYETAMSKATKADLDKTLLFEASRYAFWSIREKWPDAICFYCVPLQRASADTTELSPMLDGLTKMAKRYGFNIIDQHSESGIIRDFEIAGAEGKFLADGLHPNTAGKILQATYVCSQIIARMMY